MFHRLGRRPALDGVRAVAITAVILLHAAGAYFPGGAVGVDVFFVLSAFLITSLIMQEVHDSKGSFDFVAFYWRRFFRLGPALILWLVAIAAPTAVVAGQAGKVLGSTLVSLFYLGDFAVGYNWVPIADAYTHVWSLAMEEQFYFVWPTLLVFAVVKWRHARRLMLSVALACATFIQINATDAYFLPWGHLVPLAAGCLAAEFCMYGVPRLVLACARQSWMAILGLVAVALMTVGSRHLPGGHMFQLVTVVVALGVGLVVIHARQVRSGVAIWLLTLPPVVWMGRRSYGLYLYHRTLAQLIPGIVPDIKLSVGGPLVTVLSFAVAELSYRFVERPTMRAGHKWLKSRRGNTVEPSIGHSTTRGSIDM